MAPGWFARGPCFNDKFPQSGCGDSRTTVMGNDVDSLDLRERSKQLHKLLEMKIVY